MGSAPHNEIVMIGDSSIDIYAAINSQIRSVLINRNREGHETFHIDSPLFLGQVSDLNQAYKILDRRNHD